MSEFDDIDGVEEGGGPLETAPLEAAVADVPASLCLACGHAIAAPFCMNCGQKNDDLRRSIFILIRDFFEDTFSFDSRMWRTLGMLVAAPGLVPTNYAHGRRSRYTPPVRLFLVVSFLFFMAVGLTNTLFVGIEIVFREDAPSQLSTDEPITAGEKVAANENCAFGGELRFFVKEDDLDTNKERLDKCLDKVGGALREDFEEAGVAALSEGENLSEEIEAADVLVQRIFSGLNWMTTNPKEFNDAFNVWLPRMMFFMTPVLALILTLFIRGKDALVFDHLVLSLYVHSVSFAIVGIALIIVQFGFAFSAPIVMLGVAIYFLATLKRAYNRGWVKTIWTAAMSGIIYQFILLSIASSIAANIAWRAAA